LSKFIPLRPAKQGADGAGWRSQTRGRTGPDGGLDGGADGARRRARRRARWGLDGARRGQTGWWTKGLFIFKERMTCSVYVSCKSLSASNLSNTGWMQKKFTVTNLHHCSSNVTIRHNDATRHCDGDMTLRCDFALSRHNRQHW
jgi:hypothetical protein